METETTFTIRDPQGFEIFVYKWVPPPGIQPKGVVQIAHGAAEHASNYRSFARDLIESGYLAYANDHRGHGKTAGSLEKLGKAGDNGWDGMVNDLKLISDRICTDAPGLPLFLFGVSMGSIMSQQYIQLWGQNLAGVVLMATTGTMGPNADEMIAFLDQMVQVQGPDVLSKVMDQMIPMYNSAFEPAKTKWDWVSRDEAEVQKLANDPWNFFPFSNLLQADMIKGWVNVWKPENEARISPGLPVLMVSGAMDVFGGFKTGVELLASRYKALGVRDLTVKFYEGARHILLLETNRAEVEQDILSWLDAHNP